MKKLACIYTAAGSMPQMLERVFSEHAQQELTYNHIIDSGLIRDVIANGITPDMEERLHGLFTAARYCRPDLVVCTCSSIGEVAEKHAALHPETKLMRIDEPMCRRAAENYDRIAVMATLESTVLPSCDLIARLAKQSGREVTVMNYTAAEAFAPMIHGDMETATRIVLEKAEELRGKADVLVLAQASMGAFAAKLKQTLGNLPILNSIDCFADYLRDNL